MSLKKVSKEQPDKFEFSNENLKLANKIVLNYSNKFYEQILFLSIPFFSWMFINIK